MEPHKMAEKGSEKAPGAFSLLGTASTMGLHMVSGPVVGGGLGWLIDHWLGSWPIASAIGLVLGLIAGFRNVWADARYLERSNAALDEERKKREEAAQSAGKEVLGGVKKGKKSVEVPIVPVVHKAVGQEEGPQERTFEAGPDYAGSSSVASILAGTVAPKERDLEELDETEEAIRRFLEEDGRKNEGGTGSGQAGKGAV